MKPRIEVKQIVIGMPGGEDLVLTPEQARELQGALNVLLGIQTVSCPSIWTDPADQVPASVTIRGIVPTPSQLDSICLTSQP